LFHILVDSLKFVVLHIQNIFLCVQIPIIDICLFQSYLQRIPFCYDILHILVLLLHVINILFDYLEFYQYLIILIVLVLQLCCELLLLL
jgi:hypothetical protein